MRMWLAMLLSAAVLIGCGTFFATQDIGTADAYAIVASFFLALLSTIGSILTLAASKSKTTTAEEGQDNRPAPSGNGSTFNYAWNNERPRPLSASVVHGKLMAGQ